MVGGGISLAFAGLLVWLVLRFGLDKTDKVATISGAVIALVGVLVAGYGIFANRGQSSSNTRQEIVNNNIGGGATQIAGVAGDVTIGATGTSHTEGAAPSHTEGAAPSRSGQRPRPRPAPADSAAVGDQSLAGNDIGGSASQIRDVGGDVDIGR